MRTRRVWPSELPHIDANDRDYVASEMTAFLAALISELPCMVLNRPAANSLWGPPFTAEYWWRAAARAGFPVCCNYDKLCPDLASMLLLGMNPVRSDDGLPNNAKDVSVLLAGCAEVGLLEARFCVRHQALQQVSLRPALNEDLVARVEQYCAHPRGPL